MPAFMGSFHPRPYDAHTPGRATAAALIRGNDAPDTRQGRGRIPTGQQRVRGVRRHGQQQLEVFTVREHVPQRLAGRQSAKGFSQRQRRLIDLHPAVALVAQMPHVAREAVRDVDRRMNAGARPLAQSA
jgi:hypothetical protein